MDALALLCTLHADGPATLKRLRARGWTSLGSLLASDADELADGLGIGAPAARRLLREARMLSGRVGLEVLDEEEAPPTSIAQPGGALRPDLAELGDGADQAPGGLDSADHALVSRIVGSVEDSNDVVPAAEAPLEPAPLETPPLEGAEPEPAPVAAATTAATAESVELDLVEQFRPPAERELAAGADAGVSADELDAIAAAPVDAAPFDTVSVDAVPVDTAPEDAAAESAAAESAAADDTAPEATLGALRPGLLPGLDEALVQDLRAEDISTLDDLAQAKSLLLTRSLGVTFAQARRLQFLARREAKRVTAATGSAAAPLGAVAARASLLASSAPDAAVLSEDAPLEPKLEPAIAEPPSAAPAPVAATSALPEEPGEEPEEEVEPFEFAPAPERAEAPAFDAVQGAVEHEPVVEIFPSPPPAPVVRSVSEPSEPVSSEPEPSEPEPSATVPSEIEAADEPLSEVEAPAAEAARSEPSFEADSGSTPRADVAPAPGPVEAPAEPQERRPFWESRILDEAREADGDASDGERVDPAEIAPPPRFGERFARAAAEGRLRRSRSASGRTVLGWNFEIPRPSAENLPFASLGNPAPPAEGPDADKARETADAADASGADTSGPFA